MPYLHRDDASIYYEEYGSGFPVLVFAPGSLQSCIDIWRRPTGWFDPTVDLAKEFRVIALDLRNAGRSRAPIKATDTWDTFTQDHYALLNHLGIDRALILGQCIGGPLCLDMIRVHPDRIPAAVLLQPIGRVGSLPAGRSEAFAQWVATLKDHPEATDEVLDAYFQNLYAPGFVYNVSRDFVAKVQTPLLVMAGNDQAHPFPIAEELAKLAPNAEFWPEWKDGEAKERALKRVHEFLHQHAH